MWFQSDRLHVSVMEFVFAVSATRLCKVGQGSTAVTVMYIYRSSS